MNGSVCKSTESKAKCWWFKSNASQCDIWKSNFNKRKIHLLRDLHRQLMAQLVCRRWTSNPKVGGFSVTMAEDEKTKNKNDCRP